MSNQKTHTENLQYVFVYVYNYTPEKQSLLMVLISHDGLKNKIANKNSTDQYKPLWTINMTKRLKQQDFNYTPIPPPPPPAPGLLHLLNLETAIW